MKTMQYLIASLALGGVVVSLLALRVHTRLEPSPAPSMSGGLRHCQSQFFRRDRAYNR